MLGGTETLHLPVNVAAVDDPLDRAAAPELPCPRVAVWASPLRWPCGASPRAASGSSACAVVWCLALPRLTVVHPREFGDNEA